MKQEYKKYAIVIMIAFLAGLSLLYMFNNKDKDYEFTASEFIEDQESDVVSQGIELAEVIEMTAVPIYICGEVREPDVYYLAPTTIIKDAILSAGGFTDDADRQAWNLAMEIQKGEKIYVPKVGEQIDKLGDSYDNRVGGNEPSYKRCETININKANVQELSSLPGIGPTISQNIIDYREANGDFKNLQDVTNVSRIGQGTLEKIKDYICLQ